MVKLTMQLLNAKRFLGRAKRNLLRKKETRWGQDFLEELNQRLPLPPKTIFDVGGHRGESALKFSDVFPDAQVYTFEPSVENFEKMQVTLSGKPFIKRFNLALGADVGIKSFSFNEASSSMSRIEADLEGGKRVSMKTIDELVHELGIDEIDVLKIDTEGYELEVLRGAEKSLAEGKIGLIKIECGLDPDNSYHINFRQILDILESVGFRIFGIYEQWEDHFDPKPKLRRADIALVARHIWSARSAR